MAGSAESIRMATVESSRASCSKMSIQFQGARQMLLPWCSLLANVLIRAYQMPDIIYLCCKEVNHHLIAEKMQVYRHGS